MTVTDLISFDQIRSVLTVSKADLPDSILAGYGLEDDLLVELMSWFPNFTEVTDGLVAVKLRLFAKLHCSSLIAKTAPVFVLTRISSGDKTTERNTSESLQYLSGMLASQAQSLKASISADVGLISGLETIEFVSVSKPYRDVVTEERA